MKNNKCSRGRFCEPLRERCECAGHSGKGIISECVINLETSKTRLIGAKYKSSNKDKGVMLNFCPWCGEKILWLKEK